MISDEEAEKAIDFMAESAQKMGDAKQRLMNAQYMREIQEAFDFMQSTEKTVDAKKASARLTDAYKAACEEEAIAFGEWEKIRALVEAAKNTIAVYQTQSANSREFATAAHRGVRGQ